MMSKLAVVEHYLLAQLRLLLLWLLRLTEKKSAAGGEAVVRREETSFWQKEIHLPAYLVVMVSLAAFFIVLLFEIGLSWLKIIGLVCLLAMIFIFLVRYIRSEDPDLVGDSEAIALLGLIFTSAVLLMQLAKQWFSPLAAPVAAFTVLTGLLLSRRLAVMVGIVLCLIIGVLNDFSLEYFLVHLFSSMTAVTVLPRIRTRVDLTRIGLKLALTNVAVIMIIHFFRLWPINTLGMNVFWGVVSGFLSTLIILVTLPYLESFFSRTTSIKLLELADFNQPLLRRLMIDAPGTYHHSLIMASLAEQAAEAIGANSLLARVGAYYHDIGKLSNPDYFIENQQSMGNPHDPLTPTMSSLVVTSHVKEGVALAMQHKLDRAIVDCIQQHHGTSIIHYFYHRALEFNPEIKQDSFRYPGPRPHTKESAILMLADAVEAASRSIEEPTPGRLQDMVEKVINNKFTDGQFAECPITLRDLSRIAESMVSTLSGIYHARIEYQKTDNEN